MKQQEKERQAIELGLRQCVFKDYETTHDEFEEQVHNAIDAILQRLSELGEPTDTTEFLQVVKIERQAFCRTINNLQNLLIMYDQMAERLRVSKTISQLEPISPSGENGVNNAENISQQEVHECKHCGMLFENYEDLYVHIDETHNHPI
jgi:Asp-tRNA(Asn)/Glu-tRNA(Gln) amidotransferase A subunit family amidase